MKFPQHLTFDQYGGQIRDIAYFALHTPILSRSIYPILSYKISLHMIFCKGVGFIVRCLVLYAVVGLPLA